MKQSVTIDTDQVKLNTASEVSVDKFRLEKFTLTQMQLKLTLKN